jgi:kynurenine formamidase
MKLIDYFSVIERRHAFQNPTSERKLDRLIEYCGVADGMHVLDVGCGIGREATLHLLERGVRVAGTDAWSWDAPFSFTAKRFAETGDPSIIWEGHKASREIGYCHMEKLANLDKLPPSGFRVCCFPVKIEAASAGWTRCVALLDG